MKINSIKIENLFGMFNYDIPFNKEENITILTGANGLGKTMILNIINSVLTKKFHFFFELDFDKITIYFEENINITLVKEEGSLVTIADEKGQREERLKDRVSIIIDNGLEKEIISYDQLIAQLDGIARVLSLEKFVDRPLWINRTTNTLVKPNDLIDLFNKRFVGDKNIYHTKSEILNKNQVYFIEDQRLFQKAQSSNMNNNQYVMIETINSYSAEINKLILEVSQLSVKHTQELDSSYPKRLMSENDILSEEDYKARHNNIVQKQNMLMKFGLYEGGQELMSYKKEDAKALTVYLKDIESKLSVFDELVNKLDLFTSILNERRFSFKTINIRNRAIFFTTSKGKNIQLSQLSSGEQHEIILLYELIFNVKSNTVVLIDEPELSLHVAWQKDFLNDLMKIIDTKNIQVVVATHSPSIINDRWDLVHTLECE